MYSKKHTDAKTILANGTNIYRLTTLYVEIKFNTAETNNTE